MYNISIERYFNYREHIPFIRWESLSGSAESHYASYVAGNPSNPRSRCSTNGVGASAEHHEFRVGGKRHKGPTPVKKFPDREVEDNVISIARRAIRLRFFLDHPETADNDDHLLFIDDSDSMHYGRQGRRFAHELLSTQSFYHAIRDERDCNRVRVKKGILDYPAPAHEFSRLYKILEETIYGPIDPIDIAPFRPEGSPPYTRSDKTDRQNQLFRDWMQTRCQYRHEMSDTSQAIPMRQFIEHPSHYNLHDTMCDTTTLSTSPHFPPVDSSTEEECNVDQEEVAKSPP